MSFSHLIGNPTVKGLLEHMLKKGSLPPVLLFYGPAGIGKTLFAKVVAERLTQTTKKEAPDIHILSPEGKTHHHPVEVVRGMIGEAGFPPFEASFKVFIIEDAERMLPASSNALLKVLEEPPSDTYIILTSSEPSKLLPTIVSRCFKMQFFQIPEEEIMHVIMKRLGLSEEEAGKVALLSEGSLGKALFMAKHPHKKQLDELLQAQDYPTLLSSLSNLDETLDLSEEDEAEKIKQVDAIFEEILYWVRDKYPLMLEKALTRVTESRIALTHHLKLKTILEHFFLSWNHHVS
jgi:DNA polymerase-3 subunit delta'